MIKKHLLKYMNVQGEIDSVGIDISHDGIKHTIELRYDIDRTN